MLQNKNFESIQAFLESPITKQEDFEWDSVIWIDWREYDEYIVRCIANTVPLKYEVQSTTLPRGIDILLKYEGMQVKIPYAQAYTDRDTTLFTIADVIQPDYDLRWYMPSLGRDTLGFCVLPTKDWQVLEETYGEAYTRWYFSPVCKHRMMFDLDVNTIFAMLEERKRQKGV